MKETLRELIESWDGLAVVASHDRPTGTWIFICLHDSTLGPCTGGTRMKVYDSPEEGLRDAMRLAGAMTRKWAGIGQDFGGGKAVMALPGAFDHEARDGLLRRYGRLVGSLRGSFMTGEDLGTTTRDLEIVAEECDYVQGFDPASGAKIDPAPYTARGVYAGMRAALRQVLGADDPAGKSVLIQGTGSVGLELGKLLAGAGARLKLADIDAERAAAAAEELGGEVVPPDRVYSTPCDVYAPCAVGGTLNARTIAELDCAIIAGSANNQLAEEEDAERLHGRGILYVPDYVVNGAGALSFGLMARGRAAGDELLERMGSIGEIVAEILGEAAERGESPLAVAERRVDRRLAAARGGVTEASA